jgi:hypothetical protein
MPNSKDCRRVSLKEDGNKMQVETNGVVLERNQEKRVCLIGF